MGQYTDLLESKTCNIFDEDDFEELKKAAELFRTFDEKLDIFLVNHGFLGDIKNIDEKAEFITDKLKAVKAPIPRNIKSWYLKHKMIERRTAFYLCFAFELTIDEAADFLRRICLFRGFDCHFMEEAVYFYALKNNLPYSKVQNVLDKITLVKPKKIDSKDIIYTQFIVEELETIQSEEELITYLSENAHKFGYNNATACTAIRKLWTSIFENPGLALKERKTLYAAFDKEENSKLEEKEIPKRKERKRAEDSIWEIYLQILGLSGSNVAKYYKNRTLKPILKENDLLSPLAKDSFPDRDGLNKILNGEHVSYERVRKILILLVFYTFWADRALKRNGYHAEYGDYENCRARIDEYLVEAGYPSLYAGNPYDFIILSANNDNYPLLIFREYMQEIFYSKDSNITSEYAIENKEKNN